MQYPGAFRFCVHSAFPRLFENNPFVQPPFFHGEKIDCSEARIDVTGERGRHYIEAYLDLFNERLGIQAKLSAPRGDIHLSRRERNWYSEIYNYCGREIPFWIVCSGGKFDLPIKWWDHKRYQEVVTALRGKIQFVQVGAWCNHHPPLEGVIDLRGKTNLRDLIHLVYHARGVLCGVTSLMHLAAAVPNYPGRERAAVIIGGAREPRAWEAYPGHKFLSTNHLLGCQSCWKAKFSPPARRSQRDHCTNLNHSLPACMDLIAPAEVIQAFEELQSEGRISFLQSRHKRHAAVAVARARRNNFDQHNINPANSVGMAEDFIRSIPSYPAKRFAGRGIVICGGGLKYFVNAWVAISMLRQHGCNLPVELWHLGKGEFDAEMASLASKIGARCVDARAFTSRFPMRNALGWELKCYALLHSSFREVLFLDADNVPTRNPEYLFDAPEYKSTGAIFWPDYGRLARNRDIWKLCGVPWRDEPEFESGQMVINKETCWRPLNLAWWYNDHSEFFYRHIHGDKETFHMAWRKLNVPYAMPPFPVQPLEGTMCQHEFQGRILFQHRNQRKWSLHGLNSPVPGFQFEQDCLKHLQSLRAVWKGRINGRREFITRLGFTFRAQTNDWATFENVVVHNEYGLPASLPAGGTVFDIGAHVGGFSYAAWSRGARAIHAWEPHPENFSLAKSNVAALEGITLHRGAILHEAGKVLVRPFEPDHLGENTGSARVELDPAAASGIPAFSLDDLLRKAREVSLVKLDSEGSEWPILLCSRELHRIAALCGEFHEMESHPLCPGFGPLNGRLLAAFLKRLFPFVRVQPDRAYPRLGKFWAARSPNFFLNGDS